MQRNEKGMLRWRCGIKAEERIGLNELYLCLDIPNLGSHCDVEDFVGMDM